MAVRTDLHVHFAGVLSADDLINLGFEQNAALDVPTAKRLGIVNAGYAGEALPLATLNGSQISKLKAGLELDPEKKESL